LYVVVGLGNPGRNYQRTRHNLGWMVLEHAASRWGVALVSQGHALQGQGATAGCSVLLALPLAWMNQTGEVVHSLLQDRNLTSSDLILVYDDLDLPLGALKIKTRGGPGGHNGLRSVLSCLETENFCRLKVGIGRPPFDENPAHYVLSPFSPEQCGQVEALLPKAVDALECVIGEGIPVAMNRFHAPPLLKEPDES
jgi:PTH1 family peptidyl-tRNA hydrolase